MPEHNLEKEGAVSREAGICGRCSHLCSPPGWALLHRKVAAVIVSSSSFLLKFLFVAMVLCLHLRKWPKKTPKHKKQSL